MTQLNEQQAGRQAGLGGQLQVKVAVNRAETEAEAVNKADGMRQDTWVGGVNYDTLHTDAPAVMVMVMMVMVMVE